MGALFGLCVVGALFYYFFVRRPLSTDDKADPLLMNRHDVEMRHFPQTSIGHTSMGQTSIGHTSNPVADSVPQTSMPTTSVPGYDPYANAPMTSMGTVDELEQLLDKLKLTEYLESFRASGCDELATVALMQEDELRDQLGMKFGHAKKLRQHFIAAKLQ